MNILITGANRGLGCHLTQLGLQRGHVIIAGVRSKAALSVEMKQLKEQYGESLHFVELEVTSESSIINAASEIKAVVGMLNAIINNAAVLLGKEKFIEELDMDDVLQSFEVNTFGPMRVVKHCLPLMRMGEAGFIINISSEAGTIVNAFPTNYPYSMSKTALNMFSERLKEHLKDKGIRVYAVHPGWIKTDMGGESAPGNPDDTANGIYDIMEAKVNIYSKIAFINFLGKPMPL
ncbi:SDR family oxidoreductase [Paenibacillus radicis (ex Xue et al. 2023)]|uniref:SDR family oxidoreductase n=1 Tax=Paenibacillus radicis (ex Xue et al. 2023) TaxID=2972489 RepID=A0ABT1YJY2_9BACL|nr:SDR family oxidoreductase [Paenibacillus radicis (ex Xue et al. 2023)]MCR8633035.1 SDR family oxidoreductase [Paenibacillus radicis (ex Xue et al. 2023)]